MSQTYSIGCRQCKVHLWIAQSSCVRPLNLYSTDAHLAALATFLRDHENHPLVFGANCEGDPIGFDWEEIEVP